MRIKTKLESIEMIKTLGLNQFPEVFMKFINLNISIKIDNTSEIIDFLKQQKPDVILLQEVMMPLESQTFSPYRSGEEIISALKNDLPYYYFAPIYEASYTTKNGKKNRDFGGLTQQGTLLISKYPLINEQNIFYYNLYQKHYDTTEFRSKDWCRSLLSATLDIDGKMLKIIGVHGIWNPTRMGDERTIGQSKAILSEALKEQIPLLIGGDFNLLPQSPSIELINGNFRNLSDEFGLQTTRPQFDDGLDCGEVVVDYIFTNDKIKVNNFKTIETNISDHLPLILTFQLY